MVYNTHLSFVSEMFTFMSNFKTFNVCNDGCILHSWYSFFKIILKYTDVHSNNCQNYPTCVQHILTDFTTLVMFFEHSGRFIHEASNWDQCRIYVWTCAVGQGRTTLLKRCATDENCRSSRDDSSSLVSSSSSSSEPRWQYRSERAVGNTTAVR